MAERVKRNIKDTGKRGNATISRRLYGVNELKIECIYDLDPKDLAFDNIHASAMGALVAGTGSGAAAAQRACTPHQYQETSALIQ